MLIDICIMFRECSLCGFQVIDRHDFCDAQRSKGNNSKVLKAELPFFHSARHLMLIDICIKFRE